MKHALGRLSDRMNTLLSMFFRLAQTHADHKKLTHHIVELNKKQSSIEIINGIALCLKDILDYRLFSFAVKKEEGVDVWLDPRMYKKSLEDIIIRDFSIKNKEDLTYLNHAFYPDEKQERYDLNDLLVYEVIEENCCCKVYLLSHKKKPVYHDEIVHLILQGGACALSRQLEIENLKDAAVIDPLTGCYNRREFENQLKMNIAGAARHNKDMSVFMLDLDHFKKINDTYGHLAGDKVLQEVALLIKKNMRTGDVLARYGGEEFIAILPETGKAKAMELADRLRVKILNKNITYDGHSINVTASFGVSELIRNTDINRVIQDADTMLYKAKLNGRNTVMPGVIRVMNIEDPEWNKRIPYQRNRLMNLQKI